jgi:hypothetical protein
VIAQESLAVLKDPVVTPGMQQKLVQKPVVVVNKQEIKAVPTKVYQTPRTTTPTMPNTSPPHVLHTRVSCSAIVAPSRWSTRVSATGAIGA